MGDGGKWTEGVVREATKGSVWNPSGCPDFLQKLLKDLESQGLEINPYNPCVVNNMVADNQMTIVCHVNYLKISHMDDKKVTQNVKETKIVFCKDMQVLQGNKHNYLGMELDFSIAGKFG